jgi:signal peptidase I
MKYKIAGHSMYPTLKDGQIIEVTPLLQRTSKLNVGDIVLFRHPFRKINCLKRVKKVFLDGSVEVKGENEESEDSIGKIKQKNIIGKIN